MKKIIYNFAKSYDNNDFNNIIKEIILNCKWKINISNDICKNYKINIYNTYII